MFKRWWGLGWVAVSSRCINRRQHTELALGVVRAAGASTTSYQATESATPAESGKSDVSFCGHPGPF